MQKGVEGEGGQGDADADDGEQEGEGEPRSSPRQIRPRVGFSATIAYAGAHSAGRGVRSVVSAGAAARAEMRRARAGSVERGKVRIVVC